MKLNGRIRNGVVVLDTPCPAPDGTPVEVELEMAQDLSAPTWADVFKDVAGKAMGLPKDYAENHDHYLHGQTKR